MQKAYQKPPVLAIEDLGLNMKTLAVDPIEELARYGARLVLTSYLEAEVTALLQAGPYQRSPLRRGSRNGHRSRTRVIGRFPTEMSALSLIWSVMDQDSQRWYGLIMDGEHLSLAQTAAESLTEQPIVLASLERILAA